jgi:hypothetical protein
MNVFYAAHKGERRLARILQYWTYRYYFSCPTNLSCRSNLHNSLGTRKSCNGEYAKLLRSEAGRSHGRVHRGASCRSLAPFTALGFTRAVEGEKWALGSRQSTYHPRSAQVRGRQRTLACQSLILDNVSMIADFHKSLLWQSSLHLRTISCIESSDIETVQPSCRLPQPLYLRASPSRTSSSVSYWM